MLEFDQLCRRVRASGLTVRGAFHPHPGEFDAGTVVLLGFIGAGTGTSAGADPWRVFQGSSEARDGAPHPLDRWSRRVIAGLAQALGAQDFYPSGAPAPPAPFQRLARRCEPVHPSPIGLLIHERFGLWHAYRGGLSLRERLALPPVETRGTPCDRCADRPCLSSCPVQAFREGSFDLEACVRHVRSEAGTDCRENGCRARRACPVGPQFRYRPEQARFHMRAFLNSVGGP